MRIDVEVDLAKILDSYEITITNGFSSAVKKDTKSAESIGSPNNYNEKDITDDDEEFPEGKELTELHKSKERNPKVVREKKKRVLRESGKLECEVCGFDYVNIYGQLLGYGFAECHHTVPVSELTEGHKTKLSDLAIVCANCHRMLHKARPLISIDELRDVIKENDAK